MSRTRPLFLLSTLVPLVLVGCASTPPAPSVPTPAPAARTVRPRRRLAVPAPVRAALLPHLGASSPHRFDIAVHDIPARTFFATLVQDTPYNVVLAPGIRGRLTLRLNRVTVPEVLALVRRAYGYRIVRTRAGYIVFPRGLETRVFHINYVDVTRKGVSRTIVTSGESTEVPQVNNGLYGYGGYGGYGGFVGAMGTNGAENTLTLPSGQQASSEITTKFDSDFWKHLTAALDFLIGSGHGRSLVVSPATGIVVVHAPPRAVDAVRRYLHAVQHSLNREVIIEAKILEVTLNREFQSGINWAALAHAGTGNSVLGGQVGGSDLFNTGTSNLANQSLTLTPGTLPVSSLPTSAFGGTFALALNAGNFSSFIELLSTQGKVNVLSSPRIATVNNQQAIIKVGSDQYFVTGINSNVITSTAVATASNVQLTPFFSGISLDVTPEISDHGAVVLQIHPSVSKVTSQISTFTVSGQTSTIPLALSQIRESDTVVRALSGQVVVIGGLMKTETSNIVYRTPLLGRIPLLGQLFTQRQRIRKKTELVILLRPVVVGDRRTWSRYLARLLSHARTLRRTLVRHGDLPRT
jgi:MSHA biogenesis protein MshL